MFKKSLTAFALLFCLVFSTYSLQAQESMIGEVKMFAGNFAPRGWALCEGQLLPISSNQALFSILGTTYGGDGRTTFALPDLRGRVPIGPGNGPGLSSRRLGSKGGSETNTLTTNQLPSHGHNMPVIEMHPDEPEHHFEKGSKSVISVGNAANQSVNTGNSGGNQSVNNMQPYLGVHYIICLQGIFPSRS